MIRLTIFLILLATGIACAPESTETQNTTTDDIAMENENIALVKQYFAYFNQHDWDSMAEMYTETADFKDPSLGVGHCTSDPRSNDSEVP